MLRRSRPCGSRPAACSFWGRKNVFTRPGPTAELAGRPSRCKMASIPLTHAHKTGEVVLMSLPAPHAPPDRTPIQIGEVWENPMTGERVTILELPHRNAERRVVPELLPLVV